MWQLRQLEAFQAVMATGSMTRAAEGLHVTQPAISKLISMLEQECGFAVFVRNGNRLTPTVEGQLLYAEVSRVMLGTKEIQKKAIEIKEKRVGTLSIASFPALSTRVLPGIVAEFCKHHPAVEVLLTGRSSMFMVNWLTAHRVDLGISVLRVDEPGFDSRRLLRMEAICALPPGHPLCEHDVLTPAQIAAYPFIALSNEDRAQMMVDQFFASADARPKAAISAQLSETACQLVAEGAGVAIVDPLSVLGFERDEITFRRIAPRFLFDIWLLTPTVRPPSLITQKFIVHFSKALKDALTGGGFYFED